MKCRRRLSLSLSLSLSLALGGALALVSCGEEATVAAKEAIGQTADAAKAAGQKLVDEIASIDVSALSPEALEQKGGEVLAWVSARLAEVKDSDTAKQIAAAVEPVVDEASDLVKKAGEQVPSRAELKAEVDRLEEKYRDDPGVMKHLEPVLRKLSELLE